MKEDLSKQHFKYERYIITNNNTNERFSFDKKDEAKQKFKELSTGKNKITCEKIYPDYKQSVVIHEQIKL